jgi:hypothetical protein
MDEDLQNFGTKDLQKKLFGVEGKRMSVLLRSTR